jgi:hypothetical protein
VIVRLIIGLAGALIPALCWLIYRLAVLRHLSRAYEKGGADDVQAMANAVKTALPPATYRPWQLRKPAHDQANLTLKCQHWKVGNFQ